MLSNLQGKILQDIQHKGLDIPYPLKGPSQGAKKTNIW